MTTLVLTRRFLTDAARNPVNLLMLAAVPTVFVVIAADAMVGAAKLFGGQGGPAVQVATAGWSAGFIAVIAMYYQVRAARAADKRLVLAGLAPARLVAARLAAGAVLASVAVAAALLALTARTGVGHLVRAMVGTAMFALIYLGIGAVVGALVAGPVNGMVLILFIWILDVFLGPAMGAADHLGTRMFPTHFVTLWAMDLPSHHAGAIGDLGYRSRRSILVPPHGRWHQDRCAGQLACTVIAAVCSTPPVWNCRNSRQSPGLARVALNVRSGPPVAVAPSGCR
jgi:hypothetical protein